MGMTGRKLSLIVPCFNEVGNISSFYEAVVSTFKDSVKDIELIFVNDGSEDGTYEEIKKIYDDHVKGMRIKLVDFSRNFGKEAAILAGLRESEGEYTAIIDADLQQNPKYVKEMVEFLDANSEYDEVACYQDKRKESLLMKILKRGFYSSINKVTEVKIAAAASDFRCFRRNVLEAVLSLPEKNRFSKGLFAWVGYKTHLMPYVVEERKTGESKWTIKKLFKYAFCGITDYSTSPLLWPFKFGTVVAFVSFIAFLVLGIMRLFGKMIPDLILLMVFMLTLFGLILVNIGIIGKYIEKNTIEIKDRPGYIVRKKLDSEKTEM